jgi:hypothetical protein
MRTWAEAEREPPVKNVRAMAKELVERVAHKSASGKRRLVRTLVDFPASGDPATIRDTFRTQTGPKARPPGSVIRGRHPSRP